MQKQNLKNNQSQKRHFITSPFASLGAEGRVGSSLRDKTSLKSLVCPVCGLLRINHDCEAEILKPKTKPSHLTKTLEELLAEPYNPDPNLIITVVYGIAKVRLRRDKIKIAWSAKDE